MSKDIKRYTHEMSRMDESDTGKYIHYSDHLEDIKQYKATAEGLSNDNRTLLDQLKEQNATIERLEGLLTECKPYLAKIVDSHAFSVVANNDAGIHLNRIKREIG